MIRTKLSRRSLGAAAGLVALCLSGGAEAASRRVALVIGNAAYVSLPPLANSTNDAAKVRDTLRDAGFETFYGVNLGRLQTEALMRQFLRDADGAEIAAIYYSGHGVQLAGENFMVPVDAKLATPYDIEQQTLKVGDIFNYLTAHSRAQLIFLDACRNNPFQSDRYWIGDTLKSAEAKEGLARVNYGVGSLIAFSTEPGAAAYDGAGALSPYTTALVRHITTPNEEIRRALTLVRREVIAATGGKQVPWENSALTDDLYLMPAPPAPKVAPMVRVSAAPGRRTLLSAAAAALQRRRADDPHRASARTRQAARRRRPARSPARPRRCGIRASRLRRRGPVGGRHRARHLCRHRQMGAERARRAGDHHRRGARPCRAGARSRRAGCRGARPFQRPQRRAAGRRRPRQPSPRRRARRGRPGLVVARAPTFGVLRLGDRTLGARQQIAFADLDKVAYQPTVGSDGRKDSFALALAGRERALATVAVAPTLDACDREAASPLDLQGVGSGKLPNEIDAARATGACERAVAAYPNVARFVYLLGRAQLAAGKTAEAKRLMEQAAAAKHTRATWELGNLEAFGALGPSDLVKANVYYKQCAEAGDAYCALAYGRNLFYGRGVAQDRKAGLDLMLRAAALGHTYAMNELGYIFLYGKGMPVDQERGIRFYESGAERDDIYSLNNLGLVYLHGTGRKADAAKALALFTRASAGGHPYAPTNLGRMARDGIGGPKDLRAASRWFELAAERGDYWGALDRARLETDNATAARYLALAVSLNREGDNYDPDGLARQTLDKLAPADLKKALDQLASALGPAAIAPGASLRELLVETQGRAWRIRNPRFDLF